MQVLAELPLDEARAAADVDAVVGVGGVPEDLLVLFVEGVHRAPREGDRVT